MCSLVGLSDFSSLCRMVYFATEDFSDATFVIVNAMLYNLFMEQHSLATEPVARDEYHSYMQMCRANLETSLANTPLFLSSKVENVQALLLGVRLACRRPCRDRFRHPSCRVRDSLLITDARPSTPSTCRGRLSPGT